MGEKIRINGVDFYNLSRLDKTHQNKIERGFYANTLDLNLTQQKNKLTAILETNFPKNELLEHMLRNPNYNVSRVRGAKVPEQQLIHGYRFKHSIGDIDFIDLDTVQFGSYGIINERTMPNRLNWEWVVDEYFSTWTDFTATGDTITSTGGDLQYRTLTYHTYDNGADFPVMDATYYVKGTKSLKLGDNSFVRIVNSKKWKNFEMSAYVRSDNASGKMSLIFSDNGYDYTTRDAYHIQLDIAGNNIVFNHNPDGATKTVSLTDYLTLAVDTWYNLKVHVLNNRVSVYINDTFIADNLYYTLELGDKGFYCENASMYIDQFRIKVLSNYVSSIHPSMKSKGEQTYSSVRGAEGTQDIVFGEQIIQMDMDKGNDHVLYSSFTRDAGIHLPDKTENDNKGTIRNGSWVEDGYLDYGVELTNGDVRILDDATIQNLSEFNLHTRFKIRNLNENNEGYELNPIITKGKEWRVYDYKKSRGLQYHYAFEDDLTSDANAGTLVKYTGTTGYRTGKVGSKALDFDGSTTYQSPTGWANVQQGSVAFWLRVDAITGTHYIFRHYSDGGNRFYVRYTSGSVMQWWLGVGVAISCENPTVGEWEHYVITWSKEKAILYKNGEQFLQGNYTDFDTVTSTLYFGGNISADFMDGGLDDVRIYNRVLDANECRQLYNNGSGTNGNLNTHRLAFEIYGELLIGDTIPRDEWVEAWFQCDGKSSSIWRRNLTTQYVEPEARKMLGELNWYPLDGDVNDHSINTDNGTNNGVTFATGWMGQAGDFEDTENDYVALPTTLADKLLGGFTLSAWVNMESIDASNGQYILGFYSRKPILWGVSAGGAPILYISTDGTNWTNSITDRDYIVLSAWTHIAVSWDLTGNAYTYINGRLSKTDTTFPTTVLTGTDPANIDIGRYNDASNRYGWDGLLEDIRLYSRSLSHEEVAHLYHRSRYTDDLNVKSDGYETHNREVDLVGHWKFNGDYYDSSIYRNHLTEVGGITYNTSGKVEGSPDLDGTADYYTCVPQHFNVYADHTVTGWFYSDAFNGGSFDVIVQVRDGSDLNVPFQIYVDSRDSVKLEYIVGDGTASQNVFSNSGMSTGTWYHFACRRQNNKMEMFIDGVKQTDSQILTSDPTVVDENGLLYIGSYNASPSALWDGKLDDLRIYKRGLSDTEISNLYNSGNGTEAEFYNKMVLNELELKDKVSYPSGTEDALHQVRIWDLPYDSPSNPNMKSLTLHTKFEEGVGLYSKQNNSYEENPIATQTDSAQTTRWTTDTYSTFQKASAYLTTQDDWEIIASDVNDQFGYQQQYEMTLSAWVKVLDWTAGTGQIYLWWNDDTGGADDLVFYFDGKGDGRFSVVQGDTTGFDTDIIYYVKENEMNKWFKIDIVFAYGIWKVYINGELASRNDVTSTYKWWVFRTDYHLVHDGYNGDYYVGENKIYDRALTSTEIKHMYISDPIAPYKSTDLVCSPRQPILKNNSLFIENGFIGVNIHKSQPVEGRRSRGGVDFKFFDKGWENVGRLMLEDQES